MNRLNTTLLTSALICTFAPIVAVRKRYFRTEVLQDDADVVDLSELTQYPALQLVDQIRPTA